LDTLEALFAVAFTCSGWPSAGDVSLDTMEALFAVALLDTMEALFAMALLDTMEALFAMALLDTLEALFAVALLDTLEALFAEALLDTLEAFSSVAFAFSGWVGSALDAEKFELLSVELSRCVDVVLVVAFGVLLMFDAREECMKLRQI